MIRVLIEASSAIVRAGLEALLGTSGDIEIVPAGEDPDVILMDWERAAEEAPHDFSELAPGATTVLLVDDPRLAWSAEALRSGVRAVLPREATAAQILAAIEAAAAGLAVVPASDLDGLFGGPRPAKTAEALTPREVEVLGMLAEGHSNKQIAYRLGISEHTVKFHVTSIMAKLNAGSRTEAVTLGIRQGLIML